MKFCKDCKHFRTHHLMGPTFGRCHAPQLGLNPTSGKVDDKHAEHVRKWHGCGSGRWYVPKAQAPAVAAVESPAVPAPVAVVERKPSRQSAHPFAIAFRAQQRKARARFERLVDRLARTFARL